MADVEMTAEENLCGMQRQCRKLASNLFAGSMTDTEIKASCKTIVDNFIYNDPEICDLTFDDVDPCMGVEFEQVFYCAEQIAIALAMAVKSELQRMSVKRNDNVKIF